MNVRPLDLEEQASFLVQIKETMANLTAPLQSQLAQVNQEIDLTQAKLAELRQARNMLTQTLRSIDPDLAPSIYKKNGKKKPQSKTNVGGTMVETVTEWLQERRDEVNDMNEGHGFYASQLVLHENFPKTTQSTLSAALKTLHEQGIVRVTKHGGVGGRIYYKVV